MIYLDSDLSYDSCMRSARRSRSHYLFCVANRDTAFGSGLLGAELDNEIAFHRLKVGCARDVWVSDLKALLRTLVFPGFIGSCVVVGLGFGLAGFM